MPMSPFTAMSALLNYVWHHRIRISAIIQSSTCHSQVQPRLQK